MDDLAKLLEKESERYNTISWNVDTQYDFMRPQGKLYVPGAERIEKNLKALTEYFQDKEIMRVNTADWHHRDSKELSSTPDYVNTFPEHCIAGTKGAKFVRATVPDRWDETYVIGWNDKEIDNYTFSHSNNYVLLKDAFDVFVGNPLADDLVESLSPTRAIVYGVAGNVCVDFAVKGLVERGVEVYVVEDAIKDLPTIPSKIEEWKKMGVKLINTYELTG